MPHLCWPRQVAGCTAKLRENKDGSPYVTDNSNYIVDLYFKEPIQNAKVLNPCCKQAATIGLAEAYPISTCQPGACMHSQKLVALPNCEDVFHQCAAWTMTPGQR